MRILLATGLAVVLATGWVSEGRSADATPADQAALAAANRAWETAIMKHDMEALKSLYTKNAILLPPGAPIVKGADKITEFFGGFPTVASIKFTEDEIRVFGGTAYVRGAYALTLKIDENTTVNDTGKYALLCVKQSDGSWLLDRDMYSSDLAAAEE